MYKIILAFLLVIFSNICLAEIDKNAKAEIKELFNNLEKCNCKFQRNGSWYSNQEAISHLNKKYDYLVKKSILTNAESFINYAAAKSSLSGKKYLVQCDNTKIITSKDWFLQQLKIIRKS